MDSIELQALRQSISQIATDLVSTLIARNTIELQLKAAQAEVVRLTAELAASKAL